MRSCLPAALLLLLPTAARAEEPADTTTKAIEKGLRRLEQGSANYTENRQCFSCHHQALTLACFGSAQKRGFKVEPEKVKHQVEFTLNTFRPNLERVRKGETVPGGNTMTAYALFALEASGHGADDTTAALVEYLLVRQRKDGAWPALANRPPSEGSTFTNNALALAALKAYRPAGDARDAEELAKRIDAAFEKGREWVLKNKPAHTEDKMSRLRGLVTAGAEPKEIDAARDLLLAEQREDGSWAQLSDRPGDAYATGGVLMALRQASVKPDHAAYQKAVKYLLQTQREDGAWIVETRSRPVQVFFDNGDPGGKSQFISFAATGWAVLALLETVPAR
jgi:N-acyl-D-amino-acid deacylase